MKNFYRRLKLPLAALSAACLLAGFFYFASERTVHDRLIFLSVGQGDAAIFSSGDRQRILVDAGPDDSTGARLSRYLPWWDRRLDGVVITHSHTDHVGGLGSVIRQYRVGALYLAKNVEATRQLRQLLELAQSKGVSVTYLDDAYTLRFSGSTSLQLLPDRQSMSGNEQSLVALLAVRGARAALLADIGNEREERLAREQAGFKPQLLKVSHHGSDYGTSEALLEAWPAEQAVVSVGKFNRFGHPSRRVLKRLERHGISTFRTDENDDLVFKQQNGRWVRDR